jgi:uncharacterized membrane protein YhaH (DUF805 family)
VTWARIGAGALLAATFCLTFLVDPWQDELVSDIPLYNFYADLFLDGVLPYREIGFEYPPLAAPLIALPGLVSLDPETYRYAFAVLVFVLAAGAMFATGRLAALGGGREWVALLVVALAPVATGAMIRTHFDLAPVVCLVVGLVAIGTGRSKTGFALFGIGGAIKLFPLVAVPIAVAWLLGQGRRGEAATGLVVAAVVVALTVGAGIGLSADGAANAVEYHVDRPVQIESLPATVLNAVEEAGGRAPVPKHSHRSDGLTHPAADAITAGFLVLLAIAVMTLTVAAARLEDVRGLGLVALTGAAAVATFGKVLSPQFMLWLVPLAAVAWAWGMYALGVVTTVAGRNALLLLMLALAGWETRRLVRASRAAAGSTPQARPAVPRSGPR